MNVFRGFKLGVRPGSDRVRHGSDTGQTRSDPPDGRSPRCLVRRPGWTAAAAGRSGPGRGSTTTGRRPGGRPGRRARQRRGHAVHRDLRALSRYGPRRRPRANALLRTAADVERRRDAGGEDQGRRAEHGDAAVQGHARRSADLAAHRLHPHDGREPEGQAGLRARSRTTRPSSRRSRRSGSKSSRRDSRRRGGSRSCPTAACS